MERAKKEMLEFDINSNQEMINLKLQLRKKHNTKKIMEQRRKRMNLSDKNETIDNEINENHKKLLFDSSDILIKIPTINNISNDNINMILEYLDSNDVEKNKWAIYSLRIYFEYENPELKEYLILFENKINVYLESLLNKYENDYFFINEIFFIISNLFSIDEIINKFPEEYFLSFLNEFYLSIYKRYLFCGKKDLIISIFFIFENILTGKNDLIKNIFYNDAYSILDYINEDEEEKDLDTIFHFTKFCKMIIIAIKNEYIKNKDLFYHYLDKNFYIYKICFNRDLDIIKNIIDIINFSLDCLCIDEYENDHYITINYLFEKRKDNNGKDKFIFIHYFCSSLFNNIDSYFIDNNILFLSLQFFLKVSNNCTKAQMNELFNCESYNFLLLLNQYFVYIFKLKSLETFNETSYIINLLELSNNIIDTDLIFAQNFIISKLFENLIIYFSINLENKIILDGFLETFIRLLGYYNKFIADNLYKRGIINECILMKLLYGYNNNIFSFDNKMINNMCKIISDYLNIMFEDGNKKQFTRDDYILFIKFKEFLSSTDKISDDIKECILNLEYMKKNNFE